MNTVLDDISAVIGYSPTQRIAVWYGDTNLYVPSFPDEAHPLAKLIGPACFTALVRAFGKKALAIPHGPADSDSTRRRVAEMVVMGATTEAIAVAVNLSPRRVDSVRDELRASGLLDLVAKRVRENARQDRYQKKPPGRPVGEFSQEKAPSNFAVAKPPAANDVESMANGGVERRRAARMAAATPVAPPMPIEQAVKRLAVAWKAVPAMKGRAK